MGLKEQANKKLNAAYSREYTSFITSNPDLVGSSVEETPYPTLPYTPAVCCQYSLVIMHKSFALRGRFENVYAFRWKINKETN